MDDKELERVENTMRHYCRGMSNVITYEKNLNEWAESDDMKNSRLDEKWEAFREVENKAFRESHDMDELRKKQSRNNS